MGGLPMSSDGAWYQLINSLSLWVRMGAEGVGARKKYEL